MHSIIVSIAALFGAAFASSCDWCCSYSIANIIACVSPSSVAAACSCAASAASLNRDCFAVAAEYWRLSSHFSVK